MKLLITVVAGALLGVSAVAGKPDAAGEAAVPSIADADLAKIASSDVAGILPVVDALRSGDATYASALRLSRADYVPLRPPL